MTEPVLSSFIGFVRRTACRKGASLFAASGLLVACAGSSPHGRHGQLRLDTETAARVRHAATAAGQGARSLAPAAAPAVASVLVQTVPILFTVLGSDNDWGAR